MDQVNRNNPQEANELELNSLKGNLNNLQDELNGLKEEVKNQLENLKNEFNGLAIDKEFERGIFVEGEVLGKLEQENMELRKVLEEFYKKTLKEWYEEVRNK